MKLSKAQLAAIDLLRDGYVMVLDHKVSQRWSLRKSGEFFLWRRIRKETAQRLIDEGAVEELAESGGRRYKLATAWERKGI